MKTITTSLTGLSRYAYFKISGFPVDGADGERMKYVRL